MYFLRQRKASRDGANMKVKRFFAADMRQAMRRVREEVGPDAVIVSNTRVAGGVEVVAAEESEYDSAHEQFKREQALARQRENRARAAMGQSQDQLREELMRARSRIAASQPGSASSVQDPGEPRAIANRQISGEGDEQLRTILDSLKARKQQDSGASAEGERSAVRPASPAAGEMLQGKSDLVSLKDRLAQAESRQSVALSESGNGDTAPPPASGAMMQAMKAEIRSLKSQLAEQAEKIVDLPDLPLDASMTVPLKSSDPLVRKLALIGINERLIAQLLAGVEQNIAPEKAWRNTLARLSESIPVVGEDILERGGMVAFVGPTGVGKTTTIGKLAAQYVLKHGSSSLALVTTDGYRIAAHEQLRTFGRILDVPVRVVTEDETLEDVLQSLRNKRLVLIDTAGLNPNEPHNDLQMEMLGSVTLRLKKLLVLSCSSQHQLMEGAYAAYREMGLNGCILSKLDESGSIGAGLSLAVEHRLPIAYVADGQRIPDDVSIARRSDLVGRAVVTAQKARAVRAQLAPADAGPSKIFKAG